jgi:hypothetical protein
MRYLILIKVNGKEFETGNPPPAPLEAAMGELMGKWQKSGAMLSGEGLTPTSQGARLRLGGGKLKVTDGPFAEAKEVIGGFFIVRTDTKAQVIDMTREFLKLHEKVLGRDFEIECEVRELQG